MTAANQSCLQAPLRTARHTPRTRRSRTSRKSLISRRLAAIGQDQDHLAWRAMPAETGLAVISIYGQTFAKTHKQDTFWAGIEPAPTA